MAEPQVEIIEFVRPTGNDKTLFITNINPNFQSEELWETLSRIFSPYGLLYEVIVKGFDGENTEDTTTYSDKSPEYRPHFAFVKYYSVCDARNARRKLTGRFFLKGQSAKIRFATKTNSAQEKVTLFFSKCYEVANHYLGFNNWNIEIVKNDIVGEEESSTEASSHGNTHCISVVKLEIPGHGLKCFGFAEAKETWTKNDLATRSVATCKTRKRSYQFAVQDAFSKVILAVLPDGKVFAEVNTTVEEQINYSEDLDKASLIKVTELNNSPPSSGCEGSASAIDHINIQLLEDLDDS